MKRIISIGALLVAFAFSSVAQNKIGYINSSDLLLVMPERKSAEESLQKEAKALEEQLKAMSTEYQGKLQEYQTKLSEMSDLLKQTKAEEINNLEQRIQSFQQSAQEELQKKESELLEPILEKARAAVKVVADKNGYSHVFDSASGVVIHAPEGDDLLPLVKKHLAL